MRGFDPIASESARILILGSFPSEASLQCGQYYGNKRNQFWSIISEVFGQTDPGNYQKRKDLLISHQLALWDVIESCERVGSADTAIRKDTIRPNELGEFLANHSSIVKVCFNGAKAWKVYRASCKRTPLATTAFLAAVLPSTSPANARTTYKEKLKIWRSEIL